MRPHGANGARQLEHVRLAMQLASLVRRAMRHAPWRASSTSLHGIWDNGSQKKEEEKSRPPWDDLSSWRQGRQDVGGEGAMKLASLGKVIEMSLSLTKALSSWPPCDGLSGCRQDDENFLRGLERRYREVGLLGITCQDDDRIVEMAAMR
ncbi:hypothetical protein MA16_Dca015546 [Dendrobium catenatum]|uniref:Uncharacterized protein n=1 Tax=Dendrobium catenatum TaxID=906689 RepID=A0A2I0WKQ3_9ASPA|nr:hypothetical protein MA16_Dca015546 [Dendrobium catenatum]